ncbi:MAG: hypothetical protein HY756_04815 [Nitrospirae bacterium]|nr:hypothetical protein [Nitrospirota bacterium]
MIDLNERDLRHSSLVFLEGLLHLKPNERLLIYTDKGSCRQTAKTIHDCAQQIGAHPEMFHLDSNMTLPDMAQILTEKIQKGKYDAIFELSEQYFYQTSAWKAATDMGCRGYSLAGLDQDAFIRCVGQVAHESIFQFGENLKEAINRAKSILIRTKEGTSLKMMMNVSPAEKFFRRVLGKVKGRYIPSTGSVYQQSGRITKDERLSFMSGQLAFNGISDTIEGTAVIDGYLWPPEEIGLIKNPVHLEIKRGQVVGIRGASSEAKALDKWLDGKPKNVAHFCIGFNPGARWSGRIMEVERVFGSLSIGISTYPFHIDGVMKNPSILLDDKVIEQDGSFIHEGLSALAKDLIRISGNNIS